MRKFLSGAALAALMLVPGYAAASRNSSGTYSLFAGTTPVVSFQTVGVSLWNNAFNDLAADMTLSLDRNGRGGMLAPLRVVDGTLAAPAFSFTSETGTGFFRNTTNDLRLSIGGALIEKWLTTGVTYSVPILGNVGIGATPAYPLDITTQVGITEAKFGPSKPVYIMAPDPNIGWNIYHNGGFKYGSTSFGAVIGLDTSAGGLTFSMAPSGTADAAATMTERFRITTTGIGTDTSGFKHKRFGSLCSTAIGVGQTCSTALTWTTAFADANYTVVCAGDGQSQGIPVSGGIVSKTASGFSQITVDLSSVNAGQFTTLDCIAAHD